MVQWTKLWWPPTSMTQYSPALLIWQLPTSVREAMAVRALCDMLCRMLFSMRSLTRVTSAESQMMP